MKTGIDIKQFRKWLIKNVGRRCKEYACGCFVCDAWHAYDIIKDIVRDEKELKNDK